MYFLGVGKSAVIEAISLHAEKILRKPGDHPFNPRVLVCAPTGKAASIISKKYFSYYITSMHTMFNLYILHRWNNSAQRLQF